MTERGVLPLRELLRLTPEGDDVFSAPTIAADPGMQRLFGGHVAGQSLLAALHTVREGRVPNSIHAAFLRQGRLGVPMHLHVSRERDGRAFSTRTVTARQGPNVIFELIASFHEPEPGPDWSASPMPHVASPEDVPSSTAFEHLPSVRAFEWRALTPPEPNGSQRLYPSWVRVVEDLPEDPAVHLAAFTAMTDLGSARGTMGPGYAPDPGTYTMASLDHALWYHRPARPDRWLLFSMEALSNQAGRGLGIGRCWSEDGSHVATWVQESLLRMR